LQTNRSLALPLHDVTQTLAERLADLDRGGGTASRREAARSVSDVLGCIAAVERELAPSPAALRSAQQAFRAELAPFLARAWIVNRSITKPHGYAGDHALLDAFYTRSVSAGPAGRFLDELVLDCAAGRAVVARKRYVARWLGERLAAHPRARVADVACGPCRLERDLLDSGAARNARFVALDGDPAALEYAARVLGGTPQVELRHENAIHIARERHTSPALAGADYVVSLGLFDYLPDRIASGLLRAFRRAAQPGGELLVGNFAADNPSRAFMEWFGDWPLIHRSEREFLKLFEEAGFPARDLRLEREASGGAILLVGAQVGQGWRELRGDRSGAAAA
jgi:SAM-dependent methyltransferase